MFHAICRPFRAMLGRLSVPSRRAIPSIVIATRRSSVGETPVPRRTCRSRLRQAEAGWEREMSQAKKAEAADRRYRAELNVMREGAPIPGFKESIRVYCSISQRIERPGEVGGRSREKGKGSVRSWREQKSETCLRPRAVLIAVAEAQELAASIIRIRSRANNSRSFPDPVSSRPRAGLYTIHKRKEDGAYP